MNDVIVASFEARGNQFDGQPLYCCAVAAVCRLTQVGNDVAWLSVQVSGLQASR